MHENVSEELRRVASEKAFLQRLESENQRPASSQASDSPPQAQLLVLHRLNFIDFDESWPAWLPAISAKVHRVNDGPTAIIKGLLELWLCGHYHGCASYSYVEPPTETLTWAEPGCCSCAVCGQAFVLQVERRWPKRIGASTVEAPGRRTLEDVFWRVKHRTTEAYFPVAGNAALS